MPAIRNEPSHRLLINLTATELERLARRARLPVPKPVSRARLINLIASGLVTDDIVEHLHRLFPRPRSRPAPNRLDRLLPLHGAATVQTSTKSGSGLLLLDFGNNCRAVRLSSTALFLENRWPVFATDAGLVPRTRLYAAFVKPGRLHPAAEVAPGRSRPFILDEGEYQLRNGRLRMELVHAGPISFLVVFLRASGERTDYLFEPIA